MGHTTRNARVEALRMQQQAAIDNPEQLSDTRKLAYLWAFAVPATLWAHILGTIAGVLYL